jgi:hypothetical protein
MSLELIKLKIKAKHLAAEPAIIRHEERKLKGLEKKDLQDHRKWDVRNEARATQLAIAFLKGKDYKRIEPKLRDPFDWRHSVVQKRVIAMVKKYGGYVDRAKEVIEWFPIGFDYKK